MTDKEKAKDKRLRKTYGWTLAQYRELERLQEGRCAICGQPPKRAPLQVDHFHFKIKVKRYPDGTGWIAETKINGLSIWAVKKTKKETIEDLCERALPLSVRGLLCAGRYYRGCNRLLGRVDSIQWLEKALEYLKNPPANKLRLEGK